MNPLFWSIERGRIFIERRVSLFGVNNETQNILVDVTWYDDLRDSQSRPAKDIVAAIREAASEFYKYN